MTMLDEIDEDMRWDAERKRRLRYMRRQLFAEVVRRNRALLVVGGAVVIGVFTFMIVWDRCIQPIVARNAYLEARYGGEGAAATWNVGGEGAAATVGFGGEGVDGTVGFGGEGVDGTVGFGKVVAK